MELTVYRQAVKERPDGKVIYKGEDALPFVSDKAILVADGLGGAAAIRHQHLDPGMFEPEKLPEILFGEGWENAGLDPAYLEYVTKSFAELYAVKDCYTDNVNNIKKSGYFASRLAAAYLLYAFLFPDQGAPISDFEPVRFIDFISGLSEEVRQPALDKLGRDYAEGMYRFMRRAAKRANLIYESAYSGLSLLGTTMCLTLFSEKEDEVRALYITAGDSRPYLWNEKDGLCQLIRDEEGADGGMTNYIRANDGIGFRLNVSFKIFKKPCILFNSSDGCFDSGYFLSPLAFEKLILDACAGTSGTEEMGKSLYETFTEYGRHDDSSTIAMKMFGYEDYAALQESAKRRLGVLDEKYFSRLPGLLEKDLSVEASAGAAGVSGADAKAVADVQAGTAAGGEPDLATLQADLQQALFNLYEYDYYQYMSKDEAELPDPEPFPEEEEAAADEGDADSDAAQAGTAENGTGDCAVESTGEDAAGESSAEDEDGTVRETVVVDGVRMTVGMTIPKSVIVNAGEISPDDIPKKRVFPSGEPVYDPHPGWDLPPVIEPDDDDVQPPGMDIPPDEWKKWKHRFDKPWT